MDLMKSVIKGVGSYVPPKIMTNDDLSKVVDTSDEWIRRRTGIVQRHIADDGVLTSDIATKAAEEALKNAGVSGEEIDLIILATSTPDNTFPATATRVQANIGARGAAFDIQAVCSGFVFALTQADNMIRLGQAKKALVIGAELCSRILDWDDRSTCVLFGDGAGAVVLCAKEEGGDAGIIGSHISSDGKYYDDLVTDGGVAVGGGAGCIRMNGREVFRHAVENMTSSVQSLLEQYGMTAQNIDYLVPHQANLRIISQVGDRLEIPTEKVIITLENYANTSAATIPMALASSVKEDKFKSGDRIVLTAMGAGFCWGSVLLVWGE